MKNSRRVPLVAAAAGLCMLAVWVGPAAAQERTNEATGAFSIRGLDVAAEGSTPAERAIAFLGDMTDKWPGEGCTTFAVHGEERSILGAATHVDVEVNGIPVSGGQVHVFENPAGRIYKVVSDVPGPFALTGRFVLGETEAKSVAQKLVDESEKRISRPSLITVRKVFLVHGRNLVAAWACSFLAPDLVSSFVVLLSAEDGALLARKNLGIVEGGVR